MRPDLFNFLKYMVSLVIFQMLKTTYFVTLVFHKLDCIVCIFFFASFQSINILNNSRNNSTIYLIRYKTI